MCSTSGSSGGGRGERKATWLSCALLMTFPWDALLVLPVKLPDDSCNDRDDVKFLECALGARARYVITGDRALLRTSGYHGIGDGTQEIPRTALDLMR